MKRIKQYTIILLLTTLPFILHAQNSFVAKMLDRKLGTKIMYTITSDGEKYRYDFIESGKEGIIIVNPVKNETAILWPEKKFVHYTETTSYVSRSNDPVQALITTMNSFTEKKLEDEEIAGYTCSKSELYMGDKKTYTFWFSEELNFPLKIVNHLKEGIYMEVSGIKLQEITPSVFTVPKNFTKVDARMNPVIPEPPAPEHWNTIETNLPVKGEFQRGDLVTFKVPKTTNYIVLINHASTDPAKIIRKSFRDGKELPNNEKGPVKYRTQRIFKKEWVQNTYSWKEGDTKVLEIHEGKLGVEIKAENR